jgi:hypothetical protein
VKRKMTNYHVKHADHRNAPRPDRAISILAA